MSTAYDGDATAEPFYCKRYPIRERRQGMVVVKINQAVNGLNWSEAMKTPPGRVVEVCDATETEWDAYVESEAQGLKSTHMEWVDGKVIIVELPSEIHDHASRAVFMQIMATPGVSRYLTYHGAAYVTTRRKYEPDESFGPDDETMQSLGAVLPRGVAIWEDFHTLKVEVGYSRRWGDSDGQLDWKANQWATFPGVAYILCVALEAGRQAISYKLYEVETTGNRLPQQQPVDVVAPSTIVRFDSRRLLGLTGMVALPPGFPDPELTVDLFVALRKILRRL